MRIPNKTILATSIAAIGAPGLPALAQTAEEVSLGERVTISARRQSERLVDVPASVSVMTSQQLQRTGTDRLAGVV